MKKLTSRLPYVVIACTLFITSCIDTENQTTDFEGTWGCSETSILFGTSNYDVYISADVDNPNKLYIENFYNLSFTNKVTALISGSSISVATQTVDGYQISGTGTVVSDNSLTLDYTTYDGADRDTVSATYTRK